MFNEIKITESSLTRLSDFLAEAVESKFGSMTEVEFSSLYNLAKAYEQILTVKRSLNEAAEDGQEVNEIYFICNTVELDLMKLVRHLNYDELHMECVHAQAVIDSVPSNIFVVYRIQVGEVVFLFQCQAATDGVFNYRVSTVGGDAGIEDAWDYYLQHTPCALV